MSKQTEKIKELVAKREQARLGGGEKAIDRRNYYNFPRIFEIVDSLQPNATIFGDGGPGCRWVGNENGFAGENGRTIPGG